MRFRPLPGYRYWLDGEDLKLNPADEVGKGAKSWDYTGVTATETIMLAFLDEAVAAGMPRSTADMIRKEQSL